MACLTGLHLIMPKLQAIKGPAFQSTMSTTEPHFQMQMAVNLTELNRMQAQIQAWGEQLQWKQADIYRTQLSLEELFVNAMTHGQIPDQPMRASLSLQAKPQGLAMEWRDNGVAFNPLLAPKANPDMALDERQTGGWGLTIVRNMGKDARYERQSHGHEETNYLCWLQPWSDS
jgi:anti-sigma regulatory factor (Ser/Thr protein kinase)